VYQGRLKGLSATDNSVSSQADLYPNHPNRKYASIAPLAVRGDGPATIARLILIPIRNTINYPIPSGN
jgi:hypothetical protein